VTQHETTFTRTISRNKRLQTKTPEKEHVNMAIQQARTQGGCRGCIPPTNLKRCWHDTWFHQKSSPKYFFTAYYTL